MAFNGQGGSFTFNNVSHPVKEFTFEGAADGINVTSTGSGGYGAAIASVRKGSGSCTIFLDATAMPAIVEGVTAAAVFALGNNPATSASAGSITCTGILITKVNIKNPSEEDVEMECSYMTTGSYSYSWAS